MSFKESKGSWNAICTGAYESKSLNLPPFESVRRARQKIQRAHPELRSTPEVEEQKILNEEIVRDYAKQVNV